MYFSTILCGLSDRRDASHSFLFKPVATLPHYHIITCIIRAGAVRKFFVVDELFVRFDKVVELRESKFVSLIQIR